VSRSSRLLKNPWGPVSQSAQIQNEMVRRSGSSDVLRRPLPSSPAALPRRSVTPRPVARKALAGTLRPAANTLPRRPETAMPRALAVLLLAAVNACAQAPAEQAPVGGLGRRRPWPGKCRSIPTGRSTCCMTSPRSSTAPGSSGRPTGSSPGSTRRSARAAGGQLPVAGQIANLKTPSSAASTAPVASWPTGWVSRRPSRRPRPSASVSNGTPQAGGRGCHREPGSPGRQSRVEMGLRRRGAGPSLVRARGGGGLLRARQQAHGCAATSSGATSPPAGAKHHDGRAAQRTRW